FNLDTDPLDVGDNNPGDTINSAALDIAVYTVYGLASATLFLDANLAYVGPIITSVYNIDVVSWVADHQLYVTITYLLGDFLVDYVKISGDYSSAGGPNDPT